MQKLKKYIIAILFCFTLFFPQAYCQWSAVGSAGFSAGEADYISLYIYNGTPYVAFSDQNKSAKATVMKYDGANWVNVGVEGFSAGEADFISLYVNNGTPYVAYEDYANGDKATVMKYNGANWINVGNAGFSASAVESTSLYVYADTPFVAFTATDNNYKATVMKYNGLNWIYEGNAGFSPTEYGFLSLSISNDTPYVSFADNSYNGWASVMKFNGKNWVYVGSPGFTGDGIDYSSFYIYKGTPYIAYKEFSDTKATVMKYADSSWVTVGNAGFSAGSVLWTSLYVYNGTPYISYEDGANSDKATVMKSNGTNWFNVGNAGFSAGPVIYTSLYVYNGTPYVAYSDGGNSGKATVMSYNSPMPVELTDFSGHDIGNKVELNWHTATEVNNYGFDIERQMTNDLMTNDNSSQSSLVNGHWTSIGFIKGSGNSNSIKQYSFVDSNPSGNKVGYRLKQINNDGSFKYSKIIEVNLSAPAKFALMQNYPNPFNPTTTIKYDIPKASHVTLKVYDILGNVVETLVDKEQQPGRYNVQFPTSIRQPAYRTGRLASGVYIYRFQAGSYVQTKKMILLK